MPNATGDLALYLRDAKRVRAEAGTN